MSSKMSSKKKKKHTAKNIKPTLDIQHFIDQSSDDSLRKINQELMVGKYVEDCRKAKSKHCKQNVKSSPYTSELNLVLEGSPPETSNKIYSQISTSKFLPHPPRHNRPVSAPVYRLGIGSWTGFEDLSNSETCSVALFSTASSTRKYKPIYKRRKRVLCVLAFINGYRETYARVTAPDMPQLLIECTSKLGLTSAARKLFLRDGTQVIHYKQLVKDCEVFVSMGEPFKDPMLNLKGREKLRKSSYWTLNGIVVPSSDKKSKRISSALTKRLEGGQKRRILVFRNGECSDGVEVIANKYDEFLTDCTSKLTMTSIARCLYDWNGKVVEDFSQVPMLDKVLQPSTGVVLGPLWVTKGETFSPRGAYNFLSTMILNTKERITECGNVMKQLQEQVNEEKVLMDVEAELDEQCIVLEELEETLLKLRDHIKVIKRSFEEEEKTLSTYKFKHINEIDSNSRLIGTQSFKVRLHPNGMNTVNPHKMFLNVKLLKKGTTNKVEQMTNFFNMVNSLRELQALFGVHGVKVKVRRAFLEHGCELTDLDQIGQDEQIFLSLGEAFVPVNYSILSLSLEKAKVHNLWGSKEIVQRDFWMGADQNQTKSKLWQVVPRIPTECEAQEMKVAMSDVEKIAYLKQSSETRIRDDAIFIQSKQDHSLVLYPEITILSKSDDTTDSSMWGEHIQQWCITDDGLITNKHFKNLHLRMLDRIVKMSFENDGETEVFDGAVVSLYCRSDQVEIEGDTKHPDCHWQFTTDGYIQSSSNPGYVLTAVHDFHLDSDIEQDNIPRQGSQQWEITSSIRNQIVVTEHHTDSEEEEEEVEEVNENKPTNEPSSEEAKYSFENIPDDYGGEHVNLVAFPRFPAKHSLAATQRWGFKSKEYNVPNGLCDKWVRQNLCWPVDRAGNNLDVEGQLMFGAPKLKWASGKGNEVFSVAVKDAPLKVKVLRNGVTDMARAVTIVIPEPKNIKGSGTMESNKSGHNSSQSTSFKIFSDNCTHALRLPSAARRVFSSEGKELTSVLNLERDDLLYVSCGEGWIDPSMSYIEQQKTGLLATLVSDVEKIRRYIELKCQTGYIVCINEDTVTSDEVRLCLIKQPSEMFDDSLTLTNQQEDEVAPEENPNEPPIPIERPMTAHERSHAKLDVTNDESIDPDEETEVADNDDKCESTSKEKFSPCKWVHSNGFIHLKSNPELVMGVTKNKLNQKVVLVAKRLDSPYQRWAFSEDGLISLKYNSNMVLTVATPPKSQARIDGEYFGVYEGAKIIISHRKMLVSGSSNQFFLLDDVTGYLHGFSTEESNKNLTAANKAGVCSFAVFGKQEIYQPGYIWQSGDANGKVSAHMFCDACGKAIRGKENLHALLDLVQFSCAMGEATEKNFKFTGAFQSLNGKIDLSEGECDVTLSVCEDHLQRLREKSRLRVIASELTMAHHPAVRILAYRNGETNQDKFVHIIGKTIPEILDLCTRKLELQQAARRLYTLDGEIITHMHQLLIPYYPEITKTRHQQQINADEENGKDFTEHEVTRLDLRVPVVVWVSTGEPFISGRRYSDAIQIDAEVTQSNSSRYKKQHSGEKDSQEKESTKKKSKKDSVLSLSNKMSTMKLYQQPQALKLHVFANGESPGCAQLIFARNMEELLDHASNKLALTSCARRVYTAQGKEVFAFAELSSDQTVAVSCGERFVPYKDRRNQIEMRASWSRANRMAGDMSHCVDMEVNRSLILGQPPRTPPREEGSLIEYNDGAKTTGPVLTRRRRMLQENSYT